MRRFSLLLAPVFACASISGTVSLLDGTPITGAMIRSSTDSTKTSANGNFSVGQITAISRSATKSTPVAPHLSIENNRPRLTFAGASIAGRANPAAAKGRNAPGSAASFLPRSSAGSDTLKVYWNGKRLTVLPVSGDTVVSLRIDTAWQDDAGFPWNPRVGYASLSDPRDGQVYRTVVIGEQTWMAQNLNYSGTGAPGRCYADSTSLCTTYGRLYSWIEVMGTAAGSGSSPSGVQGVCPTGWHVPSMPEFTKLLDTGLSGEHPAIALKSPLGWVHWGLVDSWGKDTHGFRALPSGFFLGSGALGKSSSFGVWSATETGDTTAAFRWIGDTAHVVVDSIGYVRLGKSAGLSVRCVQGGTYFPSTTATAPGFNLPAGRYAGPVNLVLSTPVSGATIRYTTDGSLPSDASPIYSGPLTLSNSTTVHAMTTAPGMLNSFVRRVDLVIYGTLVDNRDGQSYRTVKIGSQIWMAQNLNYKPAVASDSSWCYGNDTTNCRTYGRLYNWASAMALSQSYGTSLWGSSLTGRQGICPTEWHVPTLAEWKKLTDTVLNAGSAGGDLKADTLWKSLPGNDRLGLAILPSGYRFIDGSFSGISSFTQLWTASENSSRLAGNKSFDDYGSGSGTGSWEKTNGFPVRCLQN